MKHLSLIACILLIKLAAGQTYAFDKGEGNEKYAATAVTVLKLITQNKPEELSRYFSGTFKLDSVALKKNCSYASSNFPYEEGSFPPCFFGNSTKTFWYERTYYTNKNGKTTYLFQVYIKMSASNNGIKVTDLQFRKGAKIVPREKEVAEMNKPVDDDNPPPAPPPSLPEQLDKDCFV